MALRKYLIVAVALTLLYVMPCMAQGDSDVFRASGSYLMDDSMADESFAVGKERAYNEAMRAIVQEANVLIKSFSEVRDSQVANDILELYTAGLVKVIDEDIQLKQNGNNLEIVVNLTAKVDTTGVDLKTIMQNKGKLLLLKDQYKILQEELKAIQADNQRLSEEYQNQQDANRKVLLKQELIQNDHQYTTNQLIAKSMIASLHGDRKNVIPVLTQAIEQSPNRMYPYIQRSMEYLREGNLTAALSDADMATKLSNKSSAPFIIRAMIYSSKNNYKPQLAIQNLTEAIKRNPHDSTGYFIRCQLYMHMGEFKKSVADADVLLKMKELSAKQHKKWVELAELKQMMKDDNIPDYAVQEFNGFNYQ